MSKLHPRLLALSLLSILGGGCRIPVGIDNKPTEIRGPLEGYRQRSAATVLAAP